MKYQEWIITTILLLSFATTGEAADLKLFGWDDTNDEIVEIEVDMTAETVDVSTFLVPSSNLAAEGLAVSDSRFYVVTAAGQFASITRRGGTSSLLPSGDDNDDENGTTSLAADSNGDLFVSTSRNGTTTDAECYAKVNKTTGVIQTGSSDKKCDPGGGSEPRVELLHGLAYDTNDELYMYAGQENTGTTKIVFEALPQSGATYLEDQLTIANPGNKVVEAFEVSNGTGDIIAVELDGDDSKFYEVSYNSGTDRWDMDLLETIEDRHIIGLSDAPICQTTGINNYTLDDTDGDGTNNCTTRDEDREGLIIVQDCTVGSTETMNLTAGTRIELLEGFSVDKGGVFSAVGDYFTCDFS